MSFAPVVNLMVTAAFALIGLLLVYLLLKSRYKKAGPDEALIVFGRRALFGKKIVDPEGRPESFRIVRGGGTFITPGLEDYDRLSLKMMTLEINLPHVYTEQGIPIDVKAVAQVKIHASEDSIRRAAESFLGMPVEHVRSTIQETVAGHLRGIIGTLTVETLYRDQKSFQDKVREEAETDLAAMGFGFKSFVFQEIRDDQGYLDTLGQPRIQKALKLYNEPGLSIEALKVLPDIAAAISESLSRAGTTTIISQGNGASGSGTGAGKLTEDVVQVLSQLGPIFQKLAGVDLNDFLKGIAMLPGAGAQNLAARVAPPEGR